MRAVWIACLSVVSGAGCLGQAPDPATAEPAPYVAMTQPERFHRYIWNMFSVEAAVRSAAGAAMTQWSDTPSEWGQGAAGYARRYGNSYAQHMMRQTIAYGLSSVLDEDNRFVPSRREGTGSRTAYAVESTFLARRSDGHRRLSYSRIGAVVATAFISREWQPHSTNGAQNALSNITMTFGTEVGFNVVREFLPNIFHH